VHNICVVLTLDSKSDHVSPLQAELVGLTEGDNTAMTEGFPKSIVSVGIERCAVVIV